MFIHRIEPIRRELNADIQSFLDLRGLQLLFTRQKPFDFLIRIEQLRFQTRWNQTPRVPGTSVLGHCFFAAVEDVGEVEKSADGGSVAALCAVDVQTVALQLDGGFAGNA